jgi:hypothetical protein
MDKGKGPDQGPDLTENQNALAVFDNPEDWEIGVGIDDMSPQQRKAWNNQTRFLLAYTILGNISQAASNIISYRQISRWEADDICGFRQRLVVAKAIFCDSLERLAFERVQTPTGNRGSDALLSHLLNAHRPEKYRDARPTDDTARHLLSELRSLSRKRKVNVDGSEEVEERVEFGNGG